jgi:hypothetical protein
MEKERYNDRILITGSPRSGTSLFTLLMSYFKDLNVNSSSETPPNLFEYYNVFKTPQRPDGKIWNDFIKEPHNIVDFIKKGIKVIVLVRDGRDCVVSKHEADPNQYWCTPVKWLNSVGNLLQCKKDIDGTPLERNLLVVRYEDLTTDMDRVMGEVESFVGHSLNHSYRSFYNDYQNKKNQMTTALNGVRPVQQNSGNWKLPEHRERMETVMKDYGVLFTEMLTKLGYEK